MLRLLSLSLSRQMRAIKPERLLNLMRIMLHRNRVCDFGKLWFNSMGLCSLLINSGHVPGAYCSMPSCFNCINYLPFLESIYNNCQVNHCRFQSHKDNFLIGPTDEYSKLTKPFWSLIKSKEKLALVTWIFKDNFTISEWENWSMRTSSCQNELRAIVREWMSFTFPLLAATSASSI